MSKNQVKFDQNQGRICLKLDKVILQKEPFNQDLTALCLNFFTLGRKSEDSDLAHFWGETNTAKNLLNLTGHCVFSIQSIIRREPFNQDPTASVAGNEEFIRPDLAHFFEETTKVKKHSLIKLPLL